MEFVAQKRAGHFSMARMYGVIVSLMSENCKLYLRIVWFLCHRDTGTV